MFQAAGWAVSPDTPASATPSTIPLPISGVDDVAVKSKSKAKKRKRNAPELLSRSLVTSDDLQKLWTKEFGNGQNSGQKSSQAWKARQQARSETTSRRPNRGLPENGEGGGKATNVKNGSDCKDIVETGMEQSIRDPPAKHSGESPLSQKVLGRVPKKSKTIRVSDVTKKMEHVNTKEPSDSTSLKNSKARTAVQPPEALSPMPTTNLTPLQSKMRDKLTSARFRHLSETLYTAPSSVSLDLFNASPELFEEYHTGFARQVKDSWPENPVDGYTHDIKSRAKVQFRGWNEQASAGVQPLPRRKTGSCTIADLGCGDAPLARSLKFQARLLSLKFHSFDLHAPNSMVTKADIANLPLRDGEADIAIFCLSLMGTNWISFVEEAWRVLRGDGKGELWVAEVKSRFGRSRADSTAMSSGVAQKWISRKPNSQRRHDSNLADADVEACADGEEIVMQDDTDTSAFINVLQRRGFTVQPQSIATGNKMFVKMVFNKTGVPSTGTHEGLKWNGHDYEKTRTSVSGRKRFIDNDKDAGYPSPEEEAKVLKPCVYKRR